MPARGRRLFAAIAVAFFVAAVALPATASRAAAATNPLSVTVRLGYHGIVKVGQWMPVTVDVTNNGSGVDGTLEVQVQGAQQGGPFGITGPAVYQMPISLAAGATKHLRAYVVEDGQGLAVTVRIVQGGRILLSQDAPSANNATALIGVLSDQSTALDGLAAVNPGGIQAQVVHLGLEDMSDSGIVLRAFDVLAIDDFATDTLTAGQRAAISDYVQNGGNLLLGTGASWRKTLTGLPTAILPMQVTGSTTLASSTALGGLSGIEIATGTLTGALASLSEGDRPLLAERTLGGGTVTMSTFDWNQEPIASWSGTSPLLRQILVRTIFGTQPDQIFGMVQGGPFGFQGASASQRSGALNSALGNVPALDLPSLLLTGALVLAYVLLVGPINYFVLGALHRRALAWITVPLIAIIAAGGAYGAGVFTKGRSVQTNQISVLHVTAGLDRAYEETYTGVIVPTRGDYQVNVPDDRLVISPITANNGQPSTTFDEIRVNLPNGAIELPAMTAFTLRGFATEGVIAAPHLTASLSLVNGKLTGTVQNLSSVSFTDGVVIAGASVQTLGPLAPGASASVTLTPTVSNPLGGPPAYLSIYPNTMLGPPANQPSDVLREGDAKTQILSLLVSGGFKGMSTSNLPLVVAWSKQPMEAITVNGSHPRAFAETAVALTVTAVPVGAGSLPAGVVTGRMVDLEGDIQQGPPGGITLQNGVATYDFMPGLVAGRHLTGVSVSSSNPYGSKGVGSTPNSGAQTIGSQVWDWSHSAWVDVAYKDNGNTTLPDAAINPSTGEVRLRISVANGGYVSTGLSLTGTVQ